MATTKVASKGTGKKASGAKNHKTLTLDLAWRLGRMLVAISDKYPVVFRTEIDFYPLVLSFFHVEFPTIEAEFKEQSGYIDFKFGGTTNPAYLELAVAPRALGDLEDPGAKAPAKTQLYAKQNRTELEKLSTIPQTRAKQRVLLLVDLRRDPHDLESLSKLYLEEGTDVDIGHTVNVLYVHRDVERRICVSRTKCGLV
jgi:hypothetical protein